MNKVKLGIVGYGNLGKGLETNIKANEDMELVGIFSRRDPKTLGTDSPAYHYDEMNDFIDKIDVMLLAGSSQHDILNQTNEICKNFNTLDAFDTHSKIPDYYKEIDKIAKDNDHLSLISAGWDPGLFSLNRVFFESLLPHGDTYTFWGKGVSQGHTDAIKSIEGVRDAVQYTIPIEENMDRIRNGENPILSTREKHRRLCYVVIEEGYDKDEISNQIKTMKDYFDEYDTEVKFISQEELIKNHSSMPHGGTVLRNGISGKDNNQIIEFSLKLDSNPEFTSAVMVSYARALKKLYDEGKRGALTVLDVPISKLSNRPLDELLKMI